MTKYSKEVQGIIDKGLIREGDCTGCGSHGLLSVGGPNDGLCLICIKVKESK